MEGRHRLVDRDPAVGRRSMARVWLPSAPGDRLDHGSAELSAEWCIHLGRPKTGILAPIADLDRRRPSPRPRHRLYPGTVPPVGVWTDRHGWAGFGESAQSDPCDCGPAWVRRYIAAAGYVDRASAILQWRRNGGGNRTSGRRSKHYQLAV